MSIPGRVHPVQENRLEDILQLTGYQVQEDSDYALKTDDSKQPRISSFKNYELLAELPENISTTQKEGVILVFMPGMMEITKSIEEKKFFQSDKF